MDSRSTDTRDRVVGCITGLAEAFNRVLSPFGLRAYEVGLAGMPPEAVEHATGQALRRCKFMPSPFELRELAGMADTTADTAAVEAWTLVANAVVRHGAYKSPLFTDGHIAAAITSLGGWVRICGLDAEEFDVHLRREFVKSYLALVKRGPVEPVRLPGIHELTNLSNGFTLDHQVTIGLPVQVEPVSLGRVVEAIECEK